MLIELRLVPNPHTAYITKEPVEKIRYKRINPLTTAYTNADQPRNKVKIQFDFIHH